MAVFPAFLKLAGRTVYLGGVVRRGGATIAISTDGAAPALAGLLREALDAALPDEEEMEAWLARARDLRITWRAAGVPMAARRPQLLEVLNRLYDAHADFRLKRIFRLKAEATEGLSMPASPAGAPR